MDASRVLLLGLCYLTHVTASQVQTLANDDASVAPTFDWGGQCASGQGKFRQKIVKGSQVQIGVIPEDKKNVIISLSSPKDVDIRLYQAAAPQTLIVGWPSGLLNGSKRQTLTQHGSSFTWSGYNGGGKGKLGQEYLHIEGGALAADVVLYAYGYTAGEATVKYTFESAPCQKSFNLRLQKHETTNLGEIPAGLTNVEISLTAATDIDVQLDEKNGKKIKLVGWNSNTSLAGALTSSVAQTKDIKLSNGKSQRTSYSGYNGVGGKKGNEWIQLHNTTSTSFVMKAYGFQAGEAVVTYSWYPARKLVVPSSATPTTAPTPTNSIKDIDLLPVQNRQDKARKVFKYRDQAESHKKLIIRRASYAQLKLTLASTMKSTQKVSGALHLVHLGGLEHQQTLVTKPKCPDKTKEWVLCLTGLSGQDSGVVEYSYTLMVPITAPIGEWTLHITLLEGSKVVSTKSVPNHNIFTIFNPYEPLDSVYMGKIDDRKEYVENESGGIWVGSANSHSGKPWACNQFNIKALIAAYHLLTRATGGKTMPIEYLSDPIRVVRALSNKIPRHMLSGKWGEPYDKGTKPWVWAGSLPIISKYLTDFKPVLYGQCFVFSGLLTTLGRTLGIPTRSVTNFESAHDHKPFDNKITKHWTWGRKIEIIKNTVHYVKSEKLVWTHESSKDSDSIWNFHVWNDMYMTRPDMKASTCKAQDGKAISFDGWQAVDSTMQERSNDQNMMFKNDNTKFYQCGPLPLTAIKNKCNTSKFDFQFIHGEVEADAEEQTRNTSGLSAWDAYNAKFIRNGYGYTKNTAKVGKFLSTSQIGGNPLKQHVISDEYKVPEDLGELGDAGKGVEHLKVYSEGFKVSVQRPDTFAAGETYKATITIEHADEKSVDVDWELTLVHYNGKISRQIKDSSEPVSFVKGKAVVSAELKSHEYSKLLKSGVTIAFSGAIHLKDKFIARFTGLKSFMEMPAIDVKLTSPVRIDRCKHDAEQISFELTVHNPFKQLPVSSSQLTTEIAGMDETPDFGNPEWSLEVPAMKPGESRTISKLDSSVTALGCGTHMITAAWDLSEIGESTDAVGSAEFEILCTGCATNQDPHDESEDRRVQPTSVVPPIQQAVVDTDPKERPTDGKPASSHDGTKSEKARSQQKSDDQASSGKNSDKNQAERPANVEQKPDDKAPTSDKATKSDEASKHAAALAKSSKAINTIKEILKPEDDSEKKEQELNM